MRLLTLENLDNQIIDISQNDTLYTIQIVNFGACHIANISKNNLPFYNGLRLTLNVPIIPDFTIDNFIIQGNFLLDSLIDQTKFGISQRLFFITAEEVQQMIDDEVLL